MTEAELKLRAGRAKAAQQYPHLAPAFWRLRLAEEPRCRLEGDTPTMGVSKDWTCYYSPEFVENLPVAQLAAVLAHEAWHLLREHLTRAEQAGVDDNVKGRHWNYAADAEINDSLADLPVGCVLPSGLGMEDGLLAEQYYAGTELRLRQPNQSAAGDAPGQCPDASSDPNTAPGAGYREGQSADHAEEKAAAGQYRDGDIVWLGPKNAAQDQFIPIGRIVYGGSCADGRRRAWEKPDPAAPSAAERTLIRRAVAEHIRSCDAELSDAERAWAGAEMEEKPLPWQRILAAEARRAMAFVSGQGDYTWTRPSRRSAGRDWLSPAIRRPKIDVAVIVDTSGSVSDEMLSEALVEVERCMQAAGGDIRVLSCDTEAVALGRTSRPRKLKMVGGGGTDMGVGIRAAEALKPKPQVIVTITDGYTDWPKDPPSARHITVLTDESGTRPAWGRTVLVNRLAKQA